MIEVNNLTRYFGPVLAVDNISFQVDKGEVVGFLGLNGAGKTTTMRILTTYLPATSGIAKVAGYDVMSHSMEVRENIGYLPESVPLYTEMRVEEYLLFRAKLKKVDPSHRMKRLEHCLDRCRIREVRRRLIGTLSKGYRQRVGLADAMIHDPAILILDEPTVGLDPVQRRETLGLIRELGKDHTILLSTHVLPEVEQTCQRVIYIHRGRVTLAKKLTELEEDRVIYVEVRGPSEKVREALRDLDHVQEVNSDAIEDGVGRYEVHTIRNRDIREDISAMVSKKGWALRELQLSQPSLEEHFVRLMRDETV